VSARCVSSRRSALRHGSRQGHLLGSVRTGWGPDGRERLSRELAQRAAEFAAGPPQPVPARWRALYERAFVAAAVRAAQPPPIPTSAKYGVE